MRRQLVLPLALLFIALGVPSNAQNADVTVDEGAPLTVECALRVEERAEWRLDGSAPPADLRPAGEAAAAGRLTARLHAPAARLQHAGVYTCARQPAQHVRVHVRAAAASSAAPGEAPTTPAAAGAVGADVPQTLTFYDVGRFFSFNCTVPRTAEAGSYVWRKNGTLVEELWDLRDRYKVEDSVFRMTVRTNEDDFGNYSCALGGAAPVLGWELRGRPHAKLPPNTNVVEGQKLKLVCKVVGKPYPDVKWLVSNSSDEGNLTDVTAALGARALLSRSEQGVDNGELVLESAVRADAGVYTCAPNEGQSAPTVLRVKDMYAALWPFLGICAEVFVLCAIILVYEKRRTKPELEDSDTDNHEQKKS